MDWQDLARAQSGVIARPQLETCGLSDFEIRGLVSRADLTRLLPGVYSPRPVPCSELQRIWSAVLWSGGTLSHRSAARLWELPVGGSRMVHITIGRAFQGRAPGISLHRVPLEPADSTTVDGLAVTNRQRTLIDLLRTERYPAATELLDRAVQQRWLDVDAVVRAVSGGLGRTGNKQLRLLMAGAEPGAHAESERVLHQLLRRSKLDGWQPQYRIQLPTGVVFVDVAFPEQRLVIEVDGRRYHDEFSDRFESDRTRQNELQALGWRVLRFTWRALRDDPAGVIAKVIQLRGAPSGAIRQDLAV